jgi:LPXTG-site transpeptidase (sortase) family protein
MVGMIRRWAALAVALLLVLSGCAGDSETKVIAAKKPVTTTTTELVTTTTEAPPVVAAAPRPQRVRTLPGVVTPKAPKPAKAAPRGPVSTGRILIPRISLDHATYEGLDMSVIDHGPSHWPGTAEPGDPGNTVFPGHRVTKTRPFYNIDLIKLGDTVTFVRSHGRYTYEVTDTFVVNADEVWIADQTENATMTIFGCHPKGSAKQRYVAKGRLVKSERNAAPAPPPPPPSGGGSGGGGSGGGGDGGSGGGGGDPTPPTTAPCTICGVPPLP